MAHESRSDAPIVAALVATVWFIGAAPLLLGGRSFAGEPHAASTLPWFDRLAGAVADGRLPEWDDASGLGAPVALEPGRPLVYPPAWLVGLLPQPWGTDALLSLQLLVFGLGAALWARRLGADPMGAVVAGGVAVLAAAAIDVVSQGGAACAMAWLPWIGWAADRLGCAGAAGLGAARGGGGSAGGGAESGSAGGGAARCEWAAGGLVVAVVLGALLLAGGGAVGPALAALAVAAAALLARAPRRGAAWLVLLAAAAAALLLSAAAWVPALLARALRMPGGASGSIFGLAEIPAAGLALWAALAGPPPVRRLAAAGAGLVAASLAAPLSADAFPAAAAAVLAVLAGLGASRALARGARLVRGRAAAGALVATAALGPLAARAWNLPFESRARLARPPALLSGAMAPAETPPPASRHPIASGGRDSAAARAAASPPTVGRRSDGAADPTGTSPAAGATSRPPEAGRRTPRPRIAWPEQPERTYGDAPPEAGARFGFAYVPGRDRARDPLLAAVWRSSSGAAERLLDLYDIQYALVPETVAVPAAMPVVGHSSSGERVLAENAPPRRPRAFIAPRWSWHRDQAALLRDLFPVAPDQRTSLALGQVRLLGAGPPPPPPGPGPEPAPPCAIATERPEDVELTCRSSSGGYAVLLDRAAPGWSAEVDGEPAPIATADLLARAVRVTRGLHRVRFHYETPGLRLGALLSAAAWLNALALAILLRRLRGDPVPPG